MGVQAEVSAVASSIFQLQTRSVDRQPAATETSQLRYRSLLLFHIAGGKLVVPMLARDDLLRTLS